MPESLHTIAEISITLAGLSGLAAAFRTSRIETWQPRERLAFWLVISNSLAALFLSLIPFTILHFGASDSAVWSICSFLQAVYIEGAIIVSLIRSSHLDRLGDPTPNRLAWAIALPASALMGFALLLSVFDILIPRGLGIYHLGLVSLLAVACMSFVLFLRFPLQRRT